MEELIKEAKWLYFQIENTQGKLVKSRLHDDKDGEKTSIVELEVEMCATLQLLKCIIEHKDNIVDLGEVWHSKDITPKENEKVIAITKHDIAYAGNYSNKMFANNGGLLYHSGIWVDELVLEWRGVKRWAYMKDLLPKGGGNDSVSHD